MSNTIKLKRGSGSDPSASDLIVGEIAIRTDSGKLFTKKDNGSVAEISGGGGIDDGDKGDITVSSSGATFTIDNGVVSTAKIADDAITAAKIATNTITNAEIAANTIGTGVLAANAVITDRIANDAVTDAKLADDASNDSNRAVGTNHIKNNAVETRCINNGAVTFDKLGSLSVGVSNIQPDSVTEDKLSDHVSNDSLRAVNTNHIKDSAVTDAKIVSVSSSKLTGALPALDGSALTGLASAEVYGFHADANGHLQQTTTNGGADNISASTYAAFEQVLLTASGFSYSVNTNGNLIVTI